MSIDNLMYDSGHPAYYTDSLRAVMEDHMTYLRNYTNAGVLPVIHSDLYRFEADLYGLFAIMGIPRQYHFVIMRVNGLDSPFVTPSNLTSIIVPPYDVIDQIRMSDSTAKRIS